VSNIPVVTRSAVDTFVTAVFPSANYQQSSQIAIRTGGAGTSYGLLYMPGGFPRGAVIVSATLHLYTRDAFAASTTITLKRLTQKWSSSGVNYTNRPTVTSTGSVAVTKASGTANQRWDFDVTAHMQLLADGTLFTGWQIESNTTAYTVVHSSQATGSAAPYKPVLEVTYSDAPDAPSTLAPSGNRVVSLAKPTLRFNFHDTVASTALQAVQVQINATNSWGAPSFDSGTVLTSDAELDLAATAYAGLADGSSTWWRVRVQDGAGVWSAWSAGAQFTRRTKGTLTITNPPVSGTISEPTPPITWTFTGRTQTAWSLTVTSDDYTDRLYESGKRTNTDTAHTLPAGILKDDVSYAVHVRIWDEYSRESTPGDTPYQYAFRDFTYDYDATVNPVTSFTVTDLAPVPGVKLAWSRATAPDSFVVRRNGGIAESGLLPGDLLVSGTNYEYVPQHPGDPWKSTTWSVHAVVNGKTSTPNPSAAITIKPQGIWLRDVDRDLKFMLLGREEGSWTMGEEAETHAPVGASHAIRITQALRGHEGSVSGVLMAGPGGTLDAQVAAFYAMKSTPGRTYMLTGRRLNIPVVVGRLSLLPVAKPDPQFQVTFDFWATERPFKAVL
jgi:hypothetical protein